MIEQLNIPEVRQELHRGPGDDLFSEVERLLAFQALVRAIADSMRMIAPRAGDARKGVQHDRQ